MLKEVQPTRVGEVEIYFDLMTEDWHWVNEWNRVSGYVKRGQFILEEGRLPPEEQARYEQGVQDAKQVLEMIRKRRPDIDRLIEDYNRDFYTAREEALQELGRSTA